MTVEEAIKMALEYEGRVHRLYLEAVKAATDDAGRRIFQVLADEERGHLEYLHSCLEEWKETGHLTAERLETVFPDRDRIEAGVNQLKKRMEPQKRKYDIELDKLKQALQVETETSKFYRDMVGQLSGEGRELFERFVEIEEGHVAIVQAEIDSVSGLGYWFDHQEFTLEGS